MAGQLVAIQAFDSNGVPAAGAKFYTYAAGTTTPKAAYSDEAGTIALSNPVVCNAAGIAACYLKSGIGDYKIALKDSTGAVFLFRTIDNYSPDTDSILYIIGSDIETARTEALDAAEAAQLAQSLAETAQAAAEAAQLAAENAETGAASSVSAAAASASAAATSATNAATSASAASTSASAAATAKTNAETAETNAETAETNAEAAQAAAEAAVVTANGVLADIAEYVETPEDTPVPSADVWTFNPATAVNTGTDKIARTAHPYFDGQLVKYVHGGGTAIGGLTTATLYYIKAPGANDFQLAATRGGAAIDLTSTGAGTAHTLADVFSLLHYAAKAQAAADDAQGHEVGAAEIVASMEEFVLGAHANATAAWAHPSATANQSIYYNTTSSDWRVLGASAPTEYILAQYNTGFDAILTTLEGGALPSGVIADQSTAETGSNNTKGMTPLRTAQAIAVNILDEDAFTTDSATKAPSQQSVGAYIKTRGTIPQSIPASGVAGTADAITLTVTGGPTLADGLAFLFQPEAANTGGVTINYNSGGAVELLDAEGAALAADALATTAPVLVRYDNAAAKWRLLSGGGGSTDFTTLGVYNVEDHAGADDLAKMQAALAAAKAAGGGKVSFKAGKTYSVNGATTQALLIDSSNITIEGNGATLTGTDNAAFYHFIKAYVADTATVATINSNASRGAVSFDVVSATGLAANDLIRIDQDKTAGGVTFVMTHWARITAIATNTLTIDTPLPFATDTAATVKTVTKVTPLENVHIRNLNFDNSGITVASGTPQGVVLMENCAYSSATNLRFIGNDKGVAFQTFYGYRNYYSEISSYKGGGGTNNDADIQIGREGYPFAENLRSESSMGFGITFYRCSYATIRGLACNNTADARGIKMETVIASTGGDWHNSYAGTTGIMFARYTSWNSFSRIHSEFNGTKTGATGDEYGVWFDDAENVNNVLSDVVSLHNGDADLFVHTSSINNVINGLQVTAATKIVMNSPAQLTGVRVGTATYTIFGHDDSSSTGPEFNSYRRSGSPAVSDNLGILRFMGDDSDFNATTYGYIYASIADPTNGSEDGTLKLGAISGGSASDRFNISAGIFAAGLSDMGAGTGNFTEVYKNGVAIGGVSDPLTLTNTDAGASAGPQINLVRDSASPANGDTIGQIRFLGEDSASNSDPYAYIFASIVDPLSGSEDGTLQFGTAVAGAFATRGYFQAGLIVGSPTGADKGVGTINATAVYDDNTLLTDLVLDLAVDGFFNLAKYANHPVRDELTADWFSADWYADYWRKERRLPGMLTWEDQANRPAVGELVTRLTAVAEAQAVLIENLNQRLKALESMAAE